MVRFGSTATGRAAPGSDTDVGILTRVPRKRRTDAWRDGLAADLESALGDNRDLDLVVLHDASPILLFEVARSGIPLWEASPAAFTGFVSYAGRVYHDTEKFRRGTRRWLEGRP